MPHPTRLFLLLLLAPLAAQPEPTSFRSLELPDGGALEYALRLPPDHAAGEAYPMLVGLLGPDATRDRAEAALDPAFAACTTELGLAVVVPFGAAAGEPAALAALLRRLRIDHRITGARLDLAGIDTGVEPAFAIALRQPFQFRTLIAVEGVLPDAERCGALRDVRVRLVERPAERYADAASPERQAAAAHLQSLGVEATAVMMSRPLDRTLVDLLRPTVGAVDAEVLEIDRVLDDFHAAAAQADEQRYFAHFAPEGVFLGTDPEERWTVDEFRAWAKPAFARESAWIFVPRRRNVQIAPGGDVAWFDEVAGSAHFGDCRGTGAVRRVDGVWRVALYDLTVPIPNALVLEVVERIRSQDAAQPDTTTVWVVRHAERDAGDDPDLDASGRARAEALARLLADVPITAAFASEYRRTSATIAPLAQARGIETHVVPARDVSGLVERIREEHRGQAVLVAGHSNTVPAILRALGVERPVVLSEDDYGDLFQVTIDRAGRARVVHLHFGESP